MSVLSKELDQKVRLALQSYSEWQVARMYNLRISAVRAIKIDMTIDKHLNVNSRRQQDLFQEDLKLHGTATGRKQETPLEMGLRLHENLFKRHDLELARVHKAVSDADYAGLEARVLSGFFTPSGRPTPAFWGYLSQYVKKSGHAMLDILHDKEIYAPEQLERALDIDSQLEDMTQQQAIALMRRVAAKVYANAFKDPSGSGADVQDSE